MKRVRFETPLRNLGNTMNDSECQSPRPFFEKKLDTVLPNVFDNALPVPYSNDPVDRFDYSNSSPCPIISKNEILKPNLRNTSWQPSTDLEISMLDIHEPRKQHAPELFTAPINNYYNHAKDIPNFQRKVLSPINTKAQSPPNVLTKDNSFFLRQDDVNKFINYNKTLNTIQRNIHDLSLDKENDPLQTKQEIINMAATNHIEPVIVQNQNHKHLASTKENIQEFNINNACQCHHCTRISGGRLNCAVIHSHKYNEHNFQANMEQYCQCVVTTPQCNINMCKNFTKTRSSCQCQNMQPNYAIEQKKNMIEQYEQTKSSCMGIGKQTTVKEKREPTVADLFKIIKLQNEQLQLLQEKVDKFILASQNHPPTEKSSIQNCNNNQLAIGTTDSSQKISIGVMTSFEMVRTSTVINHEVVKQISDLNTQSVQCNRSQISIKEVISKSQPVNSNFLDGISPDVGVKGNTDIIEKVRRNTDVFNINKCQEGQCDEKTFNELSLYNVQVDNATTPLISPEQTMYLDVRDYSDSDSGSDNNSNVGWTYYNKIMTHVNGMLQDSDMPSSASALFRNTRQKCMQMQIDKTNISVTKRVTFGDNLMTPVSPQQPQMYPGGYQQIPPTQIQSPQLQVSTDTSLKMNQLAAKYLKTSQVTAPQQILPRTVDMSFATRNYMEKHQLLQGAAAKSPVLPSGSSPNGIPRFLDITALKQQPKFL